ncbi:transglycosylase domain-containing protein, partial [Corynebacterium sanguinis]
MSKIEDGVTGGTGNEGDVKAGSSRRVSLDSIKRSRTQQWLLAALLFVLLLAAIPATWFAWQYAKVDIPQPGEIDTAQISTIYFSDGVTELARTVPAEGNRVQIPLEEVPEHVQNAVLAAEDRDFWTNSGFSFTGFARAAIGQLTGNSSAGGGSTITQQYVKNALVGNEHSYERKAKELVYSIKMTNQWEKEDILAAYLNTVYFGRNAYGIEAAAHAFFDKPASELTVEEAGVLAASIQLPSQLDPWNNPEGAESRWNYVMDGMVEMGEMMPQERATLEYPRTRDPATYSAYTEATGANGLIKNQVMEELKEIGITEDDVTNRGLQITTTIDAAIQAQAEQVSRDRLASLQDDARAALVSIEPATGAVRAYYGGDDPSGWDYANAGLQTGSTFKIFALAAALQQGIPLTATFDSSPVTLPGNNVVTNWHGGGGGIISMTEATRTSSNTAYLRIQDELDNTTQDTADMAHALGVARSIPGIPVTLRENGGQPYEGIVLGQYQSRVLDMATAMATLANRGSHHPTYFVERVVDAQGDVLFEMDNSYVERGVAQQVADNVNEALQTVVGYSNATLAGGRPAAAKTGTAQLGDTGNNKDAWMVGATPQLATAVWVGTADNTSAIFNEWGGNMYGSNTPAKIWKDVMDSALQNREVVDFPEATPVYWGINPYSGGVGLGGSRWSGGSSSGYGSGYGTGGGAVQRAPAPAPAPASAVTRAIA